MSTKHHSGAWTIVLAALGLVLASSGLAVLAGATAGAEAPIHKSYVCKYVQKPGSFELLQTGQNPIWVDNHALAGHDTAVEVGDEFSDGHILSVVIVANTPKLDPEPSIDACPALEPPPPTEVTAAAPTFRNPSCPDPTAAVVLPTTEGVTYSQSAPAAPGATVTVTAVAQEGFVLTGQSSWTHTFTAVPTDCDQGPPPPEPPNPPVVLPPVVEPPAAEPPAAAPPAAAPPAVAPPVTPSVIRAGVVPASEPIGTDYGPLGLAMLASGLVLLMGAGARSLARSRGGR